MHIFAEALSRKLAIRQRGSEWLGFFAILWILLKSMINIYKLLLKLCGENWPFVGEGSERLGFFVVLRFLPKSMINICKNMEKCNTLFNTCKMLFERKELQEYCNHYYCTGY